ncbi:MAG: hypothetical protein SWH61_06190 [Thermodesulfobacteriota bacterium]|nr:hypothetical protein [Thermodesulfobacteriota bacterium]
MTKKIRQTCMCEKCGNESEMEIVCSLHEYEKAGEKKKAAKDDASAADTRVKGTGVCTTCGNEADMWIDI